MESKLHYNTTGQQLQDILKTLMAAKEFNAFRLVGGTALSLLRRHRESFDIDLFSDAPYDSLVTSLPKNFTIQKLINQALNLRME